MRYKRAWVAIALVASLGIGLLINIPSNAFATGNVLLPPDSSDNSPPNLGLVPSQPSSPPQQPDQSPAKDTTPTMPAQENSAPTIRVIPPSPNKQPVQSTPKNSLAADLLAMISPTKESRIPKSQVNISRSGSTVIIKTSSQPAYLKDFSVMPNLDKSLAHFPITISNQSVWGPADLEIVSTKLGIEKKKVVETCILSLQGTIIANRMPATFDTGTTGKDDARYSGQILEIYPRVSALCPTDAKVPSGQGFIRQIDDKYSVNLSSTKCSHSKTFQPSQLTIVYAGNGQAKCNY